MDRVKELIETSREVIKDCQVENGAIVAANSDKEYYPENVSNYRFVWPRDAAFVIYAEKLLGMEKLENEFIEWLHDRAEGFSDSGLIFHRYATNGPRDTDFGHQYQPDQAAALLWSILETHEGLNEKMNETVHLLADGLWSQWHKDHFHQDTHDLWEERAAYHDKTENFTYTLAACSKSLFMAAERFEEEKWRKAAEEMQARLNQHGKDYYYRSFGEISDESIDASVLGLVWPFNVVERDEMLDNSIKMVEENLINGNGVMRYEGDMYDGIIHHTDHLDKGAGAWPLLSFWHVIALSRMGERDRAEELFHEQIENIEGDYIPEQIFEDEREGIEPLAWSHAMFVIAADELGYLEKKES